ncbi:hypothetical protein M3I54_22585 [Paraburkholderia sp. CNPSo 3274]|uniref:P22 phage major capsid protein family protein n=1 Tax=Paraburkholderia sp. CNPSo 3274 TaxID=2940932 RepID=UPI0020B6D057|nr:P22 phage major capsid protein family protein [Paraburkholderia sp. CNPSo 3274]MCP3709734.1 hypothetical protein [Paraburkholderia sp. CNPSo 3274]
MSNVMLTISDITYESLMVLENELVFSDKVNKEYDDKFAIAGAKIGYTVNVRRPARFKGTVGPALNVEDFVEGSVPVTLTTQFHVDTQFSTADLLLSMDDFKGRLIKPAVAAIANKVDFDGTTFAYQNTANAVGTPGTKPTAALTALTAKAIMDSEAAPDDGDRCILLDPFSMVSMADALKGLFNPAATIGEMYKKGLLGKDTLGFDWYQSQNIASYQVGAQGGTPVFSTGNASSALIASGWQDNGTLYTTGWTATTNVLNVGDVITIAGVYAVNPQNRAQWGSNQLRQFVVRPAVGTPAAGTFTPVFNSLGQVIGGQYASNGSGQLQLTIAPAIISAGQFQNVSAAPANNAAITVFGSANAYSPQSIAMHKNAFTLATADLELPDGVHFAGRAADKMTGLSIRIVRQYTINNDAIPARFDVLYGWASLYRELACRVAG